MKKITLFLTALLCFSFSFAHSGKNVIIRPGLTLAPDTIGTVVYINKGTQTTAFLLDRETMNNIRRAYLQGRSYTDNRFVGGLSVRTRFGRLYISQNNFDVQLNKQQALNFFRACSE